MFKKRLEGYRTMGYKVFERESNTLHGCSNEIILEWNFQDVL
jgi:hypothetical protein